MTIRWTLAAEDIRQTSWYFNTGGGADEEDTVEAAFDQAWIAIDGYFPNELIVDEYRWYFSSSLVPRGSPWGEADRVIDRNEGGQGVENMLPPQCSIVLSYPRPTPHKRHPGRNYLPSPTVAVLTAAGRIADSVCDAIANAYETALEACVAVGYQPVTIARVQAVDAALIIPTLLVDNVVDTQRRRGYEDYSYAATRTLTTVP